MVWANYIQGLPRGFQTDNIHVDLQLFTESRKVKKKSGYNRWEVFNSKGFDCSHCKSSALFVLVWSDKHTKGHADIVMNNMCILTVDHLYPRCAGGTDDMDNLFPMCLRCNSNKSKLDVQRKGSQ